MRKLMTAVVWVMLGVGCSADTPTDPVTDGAGGTGGLMSVAQAQGPLPQGAVRLVKGQIMDPSGFERPLAAANVLVPAGWRTQGGYAWTAGAPCNGNDYNLNWSAVGPDGVSGIAFVAKPTWSIVKSYLQFDRGPPGPCESVNWTTAKEFLEALARQTSPQARILDYQTRPDLIEQQDKFNRLLPSINDENFKFTLRTDAGQILFAHTVNGREVREMITASILFSETQMADVMNPGRVGMVIFNGVPVSVVYSRAPAGQLNARLSDVVTKSITPTAEWSRRTFQYNMKKQQDAFERMMADARYREEQRRQMFQAHQQKMADMQASQAQRDKLYDQKNLASDRTQREFIEAVRGVETYHEPVEGGVVQLDNTFNHAWRVRDGSYLLTDDPNFRPGLVGLEGQELRRVQ